VFAQVECKQRNGDILFKWSTKFGWFTVMLSLVIFSSACSLFADDSKPTPEPKKEEVSVETQLQQTIQENLNALNEKNIDQYMSMLSKETSPAVIESTRNVISNMFTNYNVYTTLKNVKVISYTDTTAVVEVTQDMIDRSSNPGFTNSRSVAEHQMVKEDGKWKFKISTPKTRVPIDNNGNIISNSTTNTTAEGYAIQKAVEDNLKAMNAENVTWYMDTLSKDVDANLLAQTKAQMEMTFQRYDLIATLKSFRIVSVSGNTAVVEVTQETIDKNNNPQFRNNRAVLQHTLVKESQSWKIKATQLKSRTYL
jgi:hypothetical protein